MEKPTKNYKVVYTIVERARDRKKFWLRIGAAFTNRDGSLNVDVYQGPVACLVLEPHAGVGWAAVDRREPVIVPDVHAFPGHIACDGRTRSEIVVPHLDESGEVIGVLDIDSHRPDAFDDEDREGLELIVAMLEGR